MKYLTLREIEDVTEALNFETADYKIVGGCDVYTIKPTKADKKLYHEVDKALEGRHESVLKIMASVAPTLTPPQAEALPDELNLSRSSAFGPLTEPSSRRTLANLIATLNASHPDYDFSHQLRPDEFRREHSYRSAVHDLDGAMYSVRPRPSSLWSPVLGMAASDAKAKASSAKWAPLMWSVIDKEMNLRDCETYSWVPEEDPFDVDDKAAIWSLNYFFYNKQLKRVCYFYIRCLCAFSSRRTDSAPATPAYKRNRSAAGSGDGESSITKRARYWLGDEYDTDSMEYAEAYEDDDVFGILEEEDKVHAEDMRKFNDLDGPGDDDEEATSSKKAKNSFHHYD